MGPGSKHHGEEAVHPGLTTAHPNTFRPRHLEPTTTTPFYGLESVQLPLGVVSRVGVPFLGSIATDGTLVGASAAAT